jgi:hypothetical protein
MSNDVARTGASTVDAIRADVLDIASTDPAFTKILSCTVFENVTDVTDANGLPPHSFEALVYDGDVPGAPNDNLIAQAIWDSKPAGIRAFGSITGTAIDKQGNSQTVSFSRVTPIPIYLTYQLVTDGTYPGNTAFEAFIAGLANAAYAASPIGADVIASRASAAAFFVAGVLDVLSLKLGFSASPSGTSNLVIGARDLARFDSSRIVNV